MYLNTFKFLILSAFLISGCQSPASQTTDEYIFELFELIKAKDYEQFLSLAMLNSEEQSEFSKIYEERGMANPLTSKFWQQYEKDVAGSFSQFHVRKKFDLNKLQIDSIKVPEDQKYSGSPLGAQLYVVFLSDGDKNCPTNVALVNQKSEKRRIESIHPVCTTALQRAEKAHRDTMDLVIRLDNLNQLSRSSYFEFSHPNNNLKYVGKISNVSKNKIDFDVHEVNSYDLVLKRPEEWLIENPVTDKIALSFGPDKSLRKILSDSLAMNEDKVVFLHRKEIEDPNFKNSSSSWGTEKKIGFSYIGDAGVLEKIENLKGEVEWTHKMPLKISTYGKPGENHFTLKAKNLDTDNLESILHFGINGVLKQYILKGYGFKIVKIFKAETKN